MYNINAFAFTLPVKIIQLAVNIIFGSVYKMLDWFLVSVLVLVGCVSLLSYMLGYRMGSTSTWNQAKYILEDSAKIAAEVMRTTYKP